MNNFVSRSFMPNLLVLFFVSIFSFVITLSFVVYPIEAAVTTGKSIRVQPDFRSWYIDTERTGVNSKTATNITQTNSSLDVYSSTPINNTHPTIDGVLSSGEWGSPSITKTMSTGENDTHVMTVYFINDNSYLYIGAKITNDDFESEGLTEGLNLDAFEIFFDNNNNGIFEVNEDIKGFDNLLYTDKHYYGEDSWGFDSNSPDGIGIATHSNRSGTGNYVYEFKIPLNSGDIEDSTIGNSVGIIIQYTEFAYQDEGWWNAHEENIDSWPDGNDFGWNSFGKLHLDLNNSAPSVTGTDPGSNAVNVSAKTDITITYNDDIEVGSDINSITVKNNSNQKNAWLKTPQISENKLTLSRGDNLNWSYGTIYTVTIPAGAVQNINGNTMAADYIFNFTIEQLADTKAPTVAGTIPVDGTIGVALSSRDIKINFSENVQPGNDSEYNKITIKCTTFNNANVEIINKKVTNNTLTITRKDDWTAQNTYKVTIPAGAIKDLAGNPLEEDFPFTFTAGKAPDITAPEVESTLPAGGAIDVSIGNKTVTIKFRENVQRGSKFSSINITCTTYYNAIVKDLDKLIKAGSDRLTLTRSTDWTAQNTYKVTIPAGAIEDLAGNELAKDYSFTFKTEALKDAPEGLTASSVEPNRVVLNWQAVSGAVSYNIHRTCVNDGIKKTFYNITGTSYTDTTVKPSTKYYYAAVAVSSGGTEGKWPTSITVTTPATGVITELKMTSPLNGSYTRGTKITLTAQVANYDAYRFYIDRGNGNFDCISSLVECTDKNLRTYSYLWDTTGLDAGKYRVGVAGYDDEGWYHTLRDASPTITITIVSGYLMLPAVNNLSFVGYNLSGTAPGFSKVEFWYLSPDGKDQKMNETIYKTEDKYEISWPHNHLQAGKYKVSMIGWLNGTKYRSFSIPVTLDAANAYFIYTFSGETGWVNDYADLDKNANIYSVRVALSVAGTDVKAYYAEKNSAQFGCLRYYKAGGIDSSQNTWVNIEEFLKASGYNMLQVLSNGATMASGKGQTTLVFNMPASKYAYLDELIDFMGKRYKMTVNDYDNKFLELGELVKQLRVREIYLSYNPITGKAWNDFDFEYSEGSSSYEMDPIWNPVNSNLEDILKTANEYIDITKGVTSILCDDPSAWGAVRAMAYSFNGVDYTIISGPGGKYNAYLGSMSWDQWAKLIYTMLL